MLVIPFPVSLWFHPSLVHLLPNAEAKRLLAQIGGEEAMTDPKQVGREIVERTRFATNADVKR